MKLVYNPLETMQTPTEMSWMSRQPEELDYMRPNGFRFQIQSLPHVNYFCQSANIPELSIGTAVHPTPLIDIPRPGEKITKGDLSIKFLIQEDMSNYIELYNWMVSLTKPFDSSQYEARFREQGFRSSYQESVKRNSDSLQYSDATLLIQGSDYNPVARVNFVSCFPSSLSVLDFDVSSGSTEYLTATAVFKYQMFTIESLTTRT